MGLQSCFVPARHQQIMCHSTHTWPVCCSAVVLLQCPMYGARHGHAHLCHHSAINAFSRRCRHATALACAQVSAGYADEIKTYLGGWGMEGLLTQRGPVLNGIVNGIDTE
jgi:glycogen synthase